MKMKLNENACRNRGFLLDGFPRNNKDCNFLFLQKPPKVNEDDDDPPDEEDKEKSFEGYVLDTSIAPRNFILLEGNNDFLKQRVKELPEETVSGTHWNDEGMTRRLKGYRESNENEEGAPSVKEFFESQQLNVLVEDAENEEEKNLEAYKVFVEKEGKPYNYMTGDQENEKERIKRLVEIENKRKNEEEKLKAL